MSKVYEVGVMKLKPGVAVAEFEQEAKVVQKVLNGFAGFIERELVYEAKSGQWVDIVQWESMDLAMAAAEKIMQMPEVMPFMQAIDESNTTMLHAIPVKLS
jgi:hypothetical protein